MGTGFFVPLAVLKPLFPREIAQAISSEQAAQVVQATTRADIRMSFSIDQGKETPFTRLGIE